MVNCSLLARPPPLPLPSPSPPGGGEDVHNLAGVALALAPTRAQGLAPEAPGLADSFTEESDSSQSPALVVPPQLPEDKVSAARYRSYPFRVPPVQMRGDSCLPRDVRDGKLNVYQENVYLHLRWMYTLYAERGPPSVLTPADTMTGDVMTWNEPTWGRIISSLAVNLKNKPQTLGDCWMSGLKADTSGYPQLHVSPGDIFVRGTNGSGRFFSSVSDTERPLVKVAKLTWFLSRPYSMLGGYNHGDRSVQTDHQCGQALCFNPWHLWSNTDTGNKSRWGCRYGCAALCIHSPTCVFVDPDSGRELLCLSSVDQFDPSRCKHDPNCREFVQKRRASSSSAWGV